MEIRRSLHHKAEELFGIDLRSLALFRMGLGLIILGDLISRACDLRAFYSDSGVLPRAALLDIPTPFWPLSLHMLNGSVAFQVLLFLLTGFFALALFFGYRTRFATFSSWLLMTSLHARNPFVNQAGDTLLHLYLFWSLFLPLGARWSVDRGLDRSSPPGPTRILSGGTVALLLQICLVYWFAAINKSGNLWSEGTALYYVFNLDAMVSSAGVVLLGYPLVLKALTHLTLWLESWGPFLAFVPLATGFFRTLAVCLFLGFHLFMIFFFKLGSFPYICMVGWLVFLPSIFWARALKTETKNSFHDFFEKPQWRRLFSRLPQVTVKTRSHWATSVLALLIITYVILMNFATTSIQNFRPVFMQKYRWVGRLLSVDQSWAMFAPDPLIENWWYEIPGKLRDGSEVELYGAGIIPAGEKPQKITAGMLNVKWRKYFSWMPKNRYRAFLPYYGRYLCREWNFQAPPGKELDSLQFYYFHEKILPDFEKSAPQKDLILQQTCTESPPSGSI